MDDALFLRATGAHIRNSKRLGVRVDLHADYAIRLLEMAERWQAHEELCRAAADALNPPPSAPSDAMR
jgi:hypothetical protein